MSWYNTIAAHGPKQSARAMRGNWRSFECFVWRDKPEHRPEDCAIVYLEHRDSDCADQSNAAAIYAALAPAIGRIDDGAIVETCSHSHWAVGHVDGIIIRCVDEQGEPTWAWLKLCELAEKLSTYPLLDENDCSEREQEAADLTWRNCYSDSERLQYIRDHRSQFEFHDLTEVAACVRGKFFGGYASELLY